MSTGAKVVDLFEALKQSLADSSSPRAGKVIGCDVCHRQKKPLGRDAAPGSYLCTDECPGYDQYPRPDTLWPGETP